MFRRSSETPSPPVAGPATPTGKRMFKVLKPGRAPPPTPVDEGSLALVMAQACCSREDATAALRACHDDVIDSIMWLSSRVRKGPQPATENTSHSSAVEMLVASTGCPRHMAQQALESCQGDVVEALLSLSKAVLTAVESDEEGQRNEEDEEDEEDVHAFVTKLQQQLKLHHRQSVNVSGGISRRDMIESEMLQSEQVYLEGVSRLLKRYVLPAIQRFSADMEVREAFERLSTPLAEVVLLHQDLMRALEAKSVAEALAGVAAFESCYGRFIETTQTLLPELERWQREGRPIESVMKELRGSNEIGDFRSHLILPVQRIPRYQLFLKDLLKTLDSASADFSLLRERLQSVELVNRGINKRLADAANRKRMAGLAAQFVSDPGLSSKAGRLLEKEGLLQLKTGPKKWSKRKLFLFNDIVAVAKKAGSKFKLLEVFELPAVRCMQVGEDEFAMRVKKDPEESKPPVELLFKAASMQEQLEWTLAITNNVARMIPAGK